VLGTYPSFGSACHTLNSSFDSISTPLCGCPVERLAYCQVVA